MVAKILTAALYGLDATLVHVEVDVANGLPATAIVGLAGASIQESRERVRSAIKNSGCIYPIARISVNLAPAHVPKMGTRYDVPIALGILAASNQIVVDSKSSLFVGELSLDGLVRPITGVLITALYAKSEGIKRLFVPLANYREAMQVSGIEVFPVTSLSQLVDHLAGKTIVRPTISSEQKFLSDSSEIDFRDIYGQEGAKRALEIVAAGDHNICLVGPPGTGKTMLAKSLLSILSPLSAEELMEVMKIYSIKTVNFRFSTFRPFRNPHHSATYSAVIGGGVVPQPGEVTLAHRGILFMDELPEFSRTVLEALREPLEENSITISKARYTIVLPAKFIFIAALNPCPCGFAFDDSERCKCMPWTIKRYQQKFSGPLLDRIDLKLFVNRIPYQPLHKITLSESSTVVKARVIAARTIQYNRYQDHRTNSVITAMEIKKYCLLSPAGESLLGRAAKKYYLSNRGIFRVLKVARTIADLADSKNIATEHIIEALHYRVGE